MKTILLSNIGYINQYGGIENSLTFLSKEYIKQGYKVIILSGRYSGNPYYNNVEIDGVTHINFNISPFNTKLLNSILFPFFIFELLFKLAYIKLNFNIEHSISRNQFVCFFVNFFFRKINVFLVPGFNFEQSSEKYLGRIGLLAKVKKKIHSYLDYLAIKKSNKIVFFSVSMLEQAKTLYQGYNERLDLTKVSISKPGVDPKVFSPVECDEKLNLRKTLNIPTNKKILLCTGRFVPAKGFDYVIKSMKTVIRQYHLVIVGDGLYFEQYNNLIKSLGLSERITLAGRSNTIYDYYKASDYFIMSSIYEPLGQSTLEAISCGLPVIAYDSSVVKTATNEILGNSAMCYIKSLSVSELAHAINNLNESDYGEYSCKSISCSKNYSWKSLSTHLLN